MRQVGRVVVTEIGTMTPAIESLLSVVWIRIASVMLANNVLAVGVIDIVSNFLESLGYFGE